MNSSYLFLSSVSRLSRNNFFLFYRYFQGFAELRTTPEQIEREISRFWRFLRFFENMTWYRSCRTERKDPIICKAWPKKKKLRRLWFKNNHSVMNRISSYLFECFYEKIPCICDSEVIFIPLSPKFCIFTIKFSFTFFVHLKQKFYLFFWIELILNFKFFKMTKKAFVRKTRICWCSNTPYRCHIKIKNVNS